MWERNDGIGESNILQNQFTAYLVAAVHRRKIQLIRSRMLQQRYEILLELQENLMPYPEKTDMMVGLPLMEQIENMKLRQSLAHMKGRDLYIFLAKVLEDRSLADIAKSLGISYNTTASVYYRIIERLKRELEGEDE